MLWRFSIVIFSHNLHKGEHIRLRTCTISQCVNKPLFIDLERETLLTCPALNGRHLLLVLRLSLLQSRAAGRALAIPSTACCSIVWSPIIQQLSATTFTKKIALCWVSSLSWQTFFPLTCQQSNYGGWLWVLFLLSAVSTGVARDGLFCGGCHWWSGWLQKN